MSLLHDHEKGFNFDRIDEFLLAGSNQCCVEGLSELLKIEKISVDISLEDTELDAPYGVDLYTWIPIKDHEIPSFDQLGMFIDVLNSAFRLEKQVYVHCKNGHGRTGTMLVAYYIKSQGMDFNDALVFVKKGRPSIHFSEMQTVFLKTL